MAESGFKPKQPSSRAWTLSHYHNMVRNFLLIAKFNIFQSMFYLIIYDIELFLFCIICLSWLLYYHFCFPSLLAFSWSVFALHGPEFPLSFQSIHFLWVILPVSPVSPNSIQLTISNLLDSWNYLQEDRYICTFKFLICVSNYLLNIT